MFRLKWDSKNLKLNLQKLKIEKILLADVSKKLARVATALKSVLSEIA